MYYRLFGLKYFVVLDYLCVLYLILMVCFYIINMIILYCFGRLRRRGVAALRAADRPLAGATKKKVKKCKKGKISLCSKNLLGKNGSLFKVNDGRGSYEKSENSENYNSCFPEGGSKNRKSNNDDKHGHGQEIRRPTSLS